MNPKLTAMVPHLDRTEHLSHVIENLLDQSIPCKILVADQGKTDATAELMEKYRDNPLVVHAPTEATCLAINWKAGYKLAMLGGAKYVGAVQDDDCVHHRYAERIVQAFDAFPESNTWTARLACGNSPRQAIWFAANGPMVPMDILHNVPCEAYGELLAPYMYFSSWALSPAVAFRCGSDFKEALDEQLTTIDLFTERTILASMGLRGRVVCDPVTVGLWLHHGENESYKQRKFQKEQTATFLEWADSLMDHAEGWEGVLNDWAAFMPSNFLEAFIVAMNGMESRYVCHIAEILRKNMKEDAPELMEDTSMIAGMLGVKAAEAKTEARVPVMV